MLIFLAFYLDDIVWLSPAFIKLYYIRGSVGLEKKDQQALLTEEGNGMFFGRVKDLGSMEERTDSRVGGSNDNIAFAEHSCTAVLVMTNRKKIGVW